MDLFEIANALAGVYYLATTDGDQPHVRPFDGAVVVDNKLYIGAGKKKAVFEQIKLNPKIEIFGMESGTIRFTAEAYPVEDEVKNKEYYEAMGKTYSETAAALELKNLVGTYTNSMGENLTFQF